MKKGFTLTELLIALGIVGVIAALTIPSFIDSYTRRIYVTQLKKVYSEITTATNQIISEENANEPGVEDPTTGFYRTSAGVKDGDETGSMYFLNRYFKTTKTNCRTGGNKCIASSYKSVNGAAAGSMYNNCVQTTSGAAICMEFDNTRGISKISVDVNGPKDPNMTGYDVFVMKIEPDGSLADFSTDPVDCNGGAVATAAETNNRVTDANKFSDSGKVSAYASGCLTKVINDGWEITY